MSEHYNETVEEVLFTNVSHEALNAIKQVSVITGDTGVMVINKAILSEQFIAAALRNGGEFKIKEWFDPEPKAVEYERKIEDGEGSPLKVELAMVAQIAMINALPEKVESENDYSELLSQALLRWRDISIARLNGGQAYLKESSDSPLAHYTFS